MQHYASLIKQYHNSLDLMSDRALAHLDAKLTDAKLYADAITELLALPREDSPTLLDIGSGVGLPGIPLAVWLEHCHVYLVERRRRRSSFLNICISQLGLNNASVIHTDIRHLSSGQLRAPVEVISALAVASFKDLYQLSQHLSKRPCYLLSRKGTNWQEEVDDFQQQFSSHLRIEVSLAKPLDEHARLIALKIDDITS